MHAVSRDHCRPRLEPARCRGCPGPTPAALSHLSRRRWSIQGSHSQPKPQRALQAPLGQAVAMAAGIPARSNLRPSGRAGSSACNHLGRRAEGSPRVGLGIRKSSPDIPESTVRVPPEHGGPPKASGPTVEFSYFASSSSFLLPFECGTFVRNCGEPYGDPAQWRRVVARRAIRFSVRQQSCCCSHWSHVCLAIACGAG